MLYMATGKQAHLVSKFVRSKVVLCVWGLCGIVGSHCLVVLRRAKTHLRRINRNCCISLELFSLQKHDARNHKY